MNRMLIVTATLVATLTGATHAGAAGADAKAPLVRCMDITYPVPLVGCGDDPLAGGRIEISRNGDVDTSVTGALPGATYDVMLHSTNASAQLPLGVLATDTTGNGRARLASVFDMNQAGVVALTLGRNGSVEFVAGFRGDHELEAGLVPCAAVNTPLALAGCGTDTLKSGKAEIEEGDLRVELSGDPSLAYDVFFRPLQGGLDVALGALVTDKKGKGSLRLRDFVPEDTGGAGNVVLRRDNADQFITGFASTRKRPPQVARFQVGMVRCADVNALLPLAGCGFDQLSKGEAILDERGDATVHLYGAVALSQYEVFFVSFDGTTEVSLGTLTTNPAGNGQLIGRDVFAVGTRATGNVVVKRNGVDQFVTGFAVIH
jgi:hypothetical protein